MKQTARLLIQTAILAVIYWSCEFFASLTGLPTPGSVLGIIVLFLLLCSGIVKEEQVSEAAGFFLKHLVFFFVSIAVGLMLWGDVFYEHGFILLVAIVVSSLLPLLAVGWISSFLCKEKKQCRK